MIHRLRDWLNRKGSQGDLSLDTTTMSLPIDGLANMHEYYKYHDGKRIPVMVIAIYNVEQLASEIAQHLKDSTESSHQDRDND